MIFSDTLAGTRYAAETYGADGRAVPGASSVLSVVASVQRPAGRALERLAEGGHTTDAWYVDTVFALRTLDELTGTPADEVVIDGLIYVVFEVVRERAVILHYECLVLRKAEGRQ